MDEILSNVVPAKSITKRMDEVALPTNVVPTKNTKNNDCYFYYYSSCSKGDACPFRHEPAALRNETVCIFWLQGNCNKKNCIFRHMELTKQRDKIACWFETQPGGCKKPHCPFQHQNILDHPREEDIKKKPDLILPVKKEENSKSDIQVGNGEESDRQVVIPKSEPGAVTPPRQAHFTPIPRNPIIVPLQDGESDSESVSGSPYKRVNPELSAQLEWELRKLRQIQAHEADIIGYVFADDNEEDREEDEGSFLNETTPPNEEMQEEEEEVEEGEYVVEEILEVEEEPDAIHRRLHPMQRTLPHHAVQTKPYSSAVLDEQRKEDLKVRRKVQISQRLGGVASRALAETLGTNVQLRQHGTKKLPGSREEQANSKSMVERLGRSPSKKLSLLERLGSRKGRESAQTVNLQNSGTEVVDTSIARKITAIRSLSTSGGSDEEPDFSFASTTREPGLDFRIKSLADIRAERQRKVTVQPAKSIGENRRVQSRLGIRNGTNLHLSDKPIDSPSGGDGLKILSLSEIKARQMPTSKNISNSSQSKKRPISPISFREETKRKFVSNSDSGVVRQKRRCVSPISFSAVSTPKLLKRNHSESVTNKRSISPISFQNSDKATRKIQLLSANCDSVQIPLSTKATEPPKTPSLGIRRISVKKSPAENETPLNVKCRKKEVVSVNVNNLNKSVSKKKIKINNNSVASESTKPLASEANVPGKHSADKSLNSSLSRVDSFLEDEEALLLGGEMADDEEDIDEAALLL